MHEYVAANRTLWNTWAGLHAASAFYDVPAFKAGRSTLTPLERDELGNVSGRTLLHLQCHFGLDTLSWAREGAVVTGVDFSDEAIRLAQSLSAELDLPATFVCADVYDLPEHLDERFDVVFTSYGVLPWLPDLRRWAAVIAHFLRPGGIFYLVEFHPLSALLDDTGRRIVYPYFQTDEPIREETTGSYAAPDAGVPSTSYEWAHPLGDVVTALLDAGLRLDFLHEFPFSTHAWPPYLEADGTGRYVQPPDHPCIPLLFSLKATR